ncbi:sigma-54 dependent transcriptional regulator [bacterium]|nr:sigma-54 dependent transcriptional regulator [bacterium]MBU1025471.1 sigma-54 dependent transcriptional regulator [bacterium]
MAISILIIDDEEHIGITYKKALGQHGIEVRYATEPEEGLLMMRYSPDIVLLDYLMPRLDGLEVLKRITSENPDQIVIMMTAYGSVDHAVTAMKLGAFHYILKPFKIETLLTHISKAEDLIKMRRLLKVTDSVTDKGDFGLLDGKSKVMRSVFKRAEKVAFKPKTSVLITGESGTGKEMLARTIHELSDRKGKLFVALNCSAIPANLLESELFGYEPGAFTGATRRKLGQFEVADGGTVFLDEIGDMPFELQAKILRVLEDSTFNRLGAEREFISVDVRVIAASNKNLEELIKKEHFRSDLYYRLNTFMIEMPALKIRGDDIIALAMKFIKFFNKEMKIDIKGLSPEAAVALKSYNWPGNVRQLRNAIESSMIECEDNYIQVENLPPTICAGSAKHADSIAAGIIKSGPPPSLDDVKNAYMLRILGQCKTDQEAADLLNVSRRTITRFKKEVLPPGKSNL